MREREKLGGRKKSSAGERKKTMRERHCQWGLDVGIGCGQATLVVAGRAIHWNCFTVNSIFR